ncbi:unnamed protein product [Symbiodinium natans]|uniref:PsbP C-terminal domain-containing protein n=1 Tax=Symbiodinium natans TaxID=878477 RepID=A0A812NVG9_9DINO|nr:unnamed protein product [Symbiodinium natans]
MPASRRLSSWLPLVLPVLLVLLTSSSSAWLGVGRRLLFASVLLPGPARADAPVGGYDRGAPRVMQPQVRYPEFIRMEGPTGDFSINIPTAWRAEFENNPGRLIYAVENTAGFNSATLQVARLSLSSFVPDANSKTSNWRDALGNTTEANIAQALMVVAQQGLSSEREGYAKTTVLETEIEAPEPNADATSLLWRAKAAVEDFRQSRIISGRALLRQGVVVFAVATGSERFGAVSGTISPSGFGWEFNNRLVGSLRLRRR